MTDVNVPVHDNQSSGLIRSCRWYGSVRNGRADRSAISQNAWIRSDQQIRKPGEQEKNRKNEARHEFMSLALRCFLCKWLFSAY